MNIKLKNIFQKFLGLFLDKPIILTGKTIGYSLVKSEKANVDISNVFTKIYHPFKLSNVKVGDYTYIAKNSDINNTIIGKFCSIGPNFCCGLGIHPTTGISTSPMFYSTLKQNGFSLTEANKVVESKRVMIENDVFIGSNVTILDGVRIGNGAIIGAGAVVTKDIPPYAIAVGVPARVVKYRFEKDQIEKLQKVGWWNFEEAKLRDIERCFFDLNIFIEKYSK